MTTTTVCIAVKNTYRCHFANAGSRQLDCITTVLKYNQHHTYHLPNGSKSDFYEICPSIKNDKTDKREKLLIEILHIVKAWQWCEMTKCGMWEKWKYILV